MTITAVEAGPRKVSRSVEVGMAAGALFDLVADPHRHGELDGSGTVRGTVSGPHRVARGERFSVKMRMFGLPYRITSEVTAFEDGRAVEWRHPAGHRWRWEFEVVSETVTRVTETFDYSGISDGKAKTLEFLGMPKRNASGIEATLRQLQERHAN